MLPEESVEFTATLPSTKSAGGHISYRCTRCARGSGRDVGGQRDGGRSRVLHRDGERLSHCCVSVTRGAGTVVVPIVKVLPKRVGTGAPRQSRYTAHWRESHRAPRALAASASTCRRGTSDSPAECVPHRHGKAAGGLVAMGVVGGVTVVVPCEGAPGEVLNSAPRCRQPLSVRVTT